MTKTTTDHQTIRAWAEKYRGQPQLIADPSAKADEIGIRIDFPGSGDDTFMPMNETAKASWKEFFRQFESQQLAFIYIEEVETADPTALSNAYRFIKRDIAKDPSGVAAEAKKIALIDELQSRDGDE